MVNMKSESDLLKKHKKHLDNSHVAIKKHPDEYREIKMILNQVILETIDIDEYYSIAERLSTLLKEMGSHTIFHNYYLENINPKLGCQARYFRYICMDLLDQISILDSWQKKKRKLHVVR